MTKQASTRPVRGLRRSPHWRQVSVAAAWAAGTLGVLLAVAAGVVGAWLCVVTAIQVALYAVAGNWSGAISRATFILFLGPAFLVGYVGVSLTQPARGLLVAGRRPGSGTPASEREATAESAGRRWAAEGAIAALIVASTLLMLRLASGSYFAIDDWLHVSVVVHDVLRGGGIASLHGPNWGYLSRDVFQHFAPGHRLGYYLVERFAPLNWGAALAGMLVLYAGCVYLLHRIFELLFGRNWWNLLLTLLFATSIVLVPSLLWLADGMHKFPATLFSLLTIYAYLRYDRGDGRRFLHLSIAAFASGLLFYDKVILVPLYLLVLRLAFLERHTSLRSVGRTLWAGRRTGAPYLALSVLYALNIRFNYSAFLPHRPPLGPVGQYLWLSWFHEFTPAVLGVRVTPHPSAFEYGAIVGGQLALVALVAITIVRRPSAWRAWAFWLGAFLVNAGLIGVARLQQFGIQDVGYQLRYHTELAWLLPLIIGLAFAPSAVVGARAGAAASPVSERPALATRLQGSVLSRLSPAVGLGLLAVYLVVAASTGTVMARNWRAAKSDPPKRLLQHLRADAGALRARGQRPVVLDARPPTFILDSFIQPFARWSYIMPALDPDVHVAVAATGARWVHPDGRLAPARFLAVAADRQLRARDLHVTSGRLVHQGGQPCLQSDRLAQVEFTDTGSAYDPDTYLELRVRATRPGTPDAAVSGDRGSAQLEYLTDAVSLPPRPQPVLVARAGRRLVAQLPPRSTVCLLGARVGVVR